MLILQSTDKLQLVTGGSPPQVDCHVSWMDNAAGAVNPGRTNTPTINAAGTTDIVASPAAGTFRAIKTMHVRNRGITQIPVTVVHNDGTVAAQLVQVFLAGGETLQYIDEVGFIRSSAAAFSGIFIQKFQTPGPFTYTPSTGMVYAIMECVGGGGGGGAAYIGSGNEYMVGAGGGSGGYSRTIMTAAQIGASQPGVVGAGGAGGVPVTASPNGSDGAVTSIGTTPFLCLANGGLGGKFSSDTPVQNGVGGRGGSPGTGDIAAAGAPGDGGFLNLLNSVIGCRSGLGGSSVWGGGAEGSNAGNGFDGYSYGSGGSGANQGGSGGKGSGGIALITEIISR